MTFITVIRSTTFPSTSVDVELTGTFTGTFTGDITGNVLDSTCITFADGQGIKIGNVTTSVIDETSIAIGKTASSTGINSVTMGHMASSSSDDTVAIGGLSQCSGSVSVALGAAANAAGTGSIAIGRESDATLTYSIALGHFTQATGSGGIAIGGGTTSGDSANATAADAIAIGRNSGSSGANSIAIGLNATATLEDQIALGRTGASGSATAEAWGQLFQDRGWADTGDKISGINGTGDIYKTTINVSDLSDLGNITTRCLTGTRTGAGTLILSDKQIIPTDEVWGFTVDVVGRETGSGNIFYESQSILAFNDAGTVSTTAVTTISSYGVGDLSGDSFTVTGNTDGIDITVTTSSTGTTNWTGKLHITTVN